ncbi:MAG: spore protease YyaC [Bacillota bacterium]
MFNPFFAAAYTTAGPQGNLNSKKIKFHYEEPYLALKMGRALAQYLSELDAEGKKTLVALCIGTDRSTGDSLGPLVGTKLKNSPARLEVYGTLNKPVHAANLSEQLKEIQKLHPDSLFIAIDACLGKSENIGQITLSPGALKPGAGVKKTLPPVGDVHFTGTVNVSGYMEYFVLQNTRLGLIWDMAELISASISHGLLLHKFRMQEISASASL